MALHEARSLLEQMTVLAALDIEAYAANPSPYHVTVGQVRPYPGYQTALATIRQCLHGGQLHNTPFSQQKHLQSPLTFRTAANVLGAAYDALDFCQSQVSIELNAHQQNPLALHEEDCMLPCGNFDMQPLAQAMDIARLALAPCLTVQVERSIKMLQQRDTGLTDGLAHTNEEGAIGHGFSEIAWPLQAMAAEARLLGVQVVSAEIGSSGMAESIEDRMTMAGLSARKLREFVQLTLRCVAISTTLACQAIDLRECQLGRQLQQVHRKVRALVPTMEAGDSPPLTLEHLVDALQVGRELLRVEPGVGGSRL